MKLILVLCLFAFGMGSSVFAAEDRYAVPNITYTCTARIAQDWPRGRHGTLIADTEPFELRMPSSATLELTADKFKSFPEISSARTLEQTDLAEAELSLKLVLLARNGGQPGAGLEGTLSVKPAQANVPLSISFDTQGDGVPSKLQAGAELRAGSRKQIVANGPIYVRVYCDLKRLF